jgi:energy-converting hydrogenase B subunit A
LFLIRILYALAYIAVLTYNMIKSTLHVALLSLTGGINPQVIVIKTRLKKPFSQVILANSITLTPGTLTIDIDSGKQELTVAVLTPRSQEEVIPFEGFIGGMLE